MAEGRMITFKTLNCADCPYYEVRAVILGHIDALPWCQDANGPGDLTDYSVGIHPDCPYPEVST